MPRRSFIKGTVDQRYLSFCCKIRSYIHENNDHLDIFIFTLITIKEYINQKEKNIYDLEIFHTKLEEMNKITDIYPAHFKYFI